MKTFEGDLSFDAFEDHLYRELSRAQSVSENLILGKNLSCCPFQSDFSWNQLKSVLSCQPLTISVRNDRNINLGSNISNRAGKEVEEDSKVSTPSTPYLYRSSRRCLDVKKRPILPKIDNRRDHLRIYLKKMGLAWSLISSLWNHFRILFYNKQNTKYINCPE